MVHSIINWDILLSLFFSRLGLVISLVVGFWVIVKVIRFYFSFAYPIDKPSDDLSDYYEPDKKLYEYMTRSEQRLLDESAYEKASKRRDVEARRVRSRARRKYREDVKRGFDLDKLYSDLDSEIED